MAMVAIAHRKLLQAQDPNQNSTCSDCGPTCRYKCSYPEFYWPPQPPPTPPHTTTHISPYVIIIVTLLASAFLFFSYYLIMVRCSTRFRRAPLTPISTQDQNFPNQDHMLELELDHPIWYINTIGLQPSVINSITIFKYKTLDNLIECTVCSICLNEFQDNETLRLLPKCNHAFHIPCIDTWLSSHTNCPLCRAGILSNTLGAVLSSNDRNDFTTRDGVNDANVHTQMGNLENDGGSSGNVVPEIENCDENDDSKTEYESIIGEQRSVSMDSVAIEDIIEE